jgi:OOP family OmpA-OmpF porin
MKARRYLPMIVSALVALPMAASAEAGKFYVTPLAGVEHFESSDLEQSVHYGLSGLQMYNDNLGAELSYTVGEADVSGTNDEVDIDQIFLRGIYSLGKMGFEQRWEPFFSLGVGNVTFDDGDNDDDEVEAGAGLGVRFHFNERLSSVLSAEQRHGLNSSYNGQFYTLGLSFAFGGEAPKAAEPAPVAAAPAAPVDSDGDGVYDDKDECPGTPAGREVDEKGCEYKLKKSEEMKLDILFDTAKSDIKSQYQGEVERAAKFLKRYAGVQAVIEGHTDSDGSDAYNQKLSQARADAVKAMLINQYGIDASRLSAVGYGEGRPVASNTTKAGKAENRRVVAVFKAEVEVDPNKR